MCVCVCDDISQDQAQVLSYEQTERQLWSFDAWVDAWEWVWDRFWSVTMYSNGTLPLPLPLDVPLDTRCVYTLMAHSHCTGSVSILHYVLYTLHRDRDRDRDNLFSIVSIPVPVPVLFPVPCSVYEPLIIQQVFELNNRTPIHMKGCQLVLLWRVTIFFGASWSICQNL